MPMLKIMLFFGISIYFASMVYSWVHYPLIMIAIAVAVWVVLILSSEWDYVIWPDPKDRKDL